MTRRTLQPPVSNIINEHATTKWTGGSYDYDDVMRAILRVNRPEIRPGTTFTNATPIAPILEQERHLRRFGRRAALETSRPR